MTNPHFPQHPIGDTYRHTPGTQNTVIMSGAAAIEEVAVAEAATASTIPRRTAAGILVAADGVAAGDVSTVGQTATAIGAQPLSSHTFGTTPSAVVRTNGTGDGIEEITTSTTAVAGGIPVYDGDGGIDFDKLDPPYKAKAPVAQCYRQVILYTDLTSAGAAEEVDLNVLFPADTFPERCRVESAHIELVAAPDDGTSGVSLTALTVALGDTALPAELVTASETYGGSPGDLIVADGVYAHNTYEAAYVPTLTLTATGQTLDNLTAGGWEVNIWCVPIKLRP